jgi:hypothetical protein
MYATFPSLLETVWNAHARRLEREVELSLINAIMQELDEAQNARANGATHAVKPAELYRKYASSLRTIKENSRDQDNVSLAHELLTDLFLSQSLPASELESPDWIDSYTGELIEDDEVDWELDSLPTLMERVEMVSPASEEMYQRAVEFKKTLNWSQDDLNAFLRAQSAFENTGEEVFYDDRAYVPPTLEKDWVIDYSAFAITTPALSAFSEWRTQIFAAMKKNGTDGMSWKACFASHKEESVEVADLISAIESVAESYDIVTAAAIALKVIGDYGLTSDDLDHIGGFQPNGRYSGLNEFIEVWGDDILDLLQDGSGSKSDVGIDLMDKVNTQQLTEILPEKHHNPMHTRSYILAYIQAMANGATLRQAESTALAAWREAMSSKGAQAFDSAWHHSHNMSTAWRAFWQHCGPDVPRPKEHVKSVLKMGDKFRGLVLSSGREIDWRITEIKLKNNEIEWYPGQQAKLKALLTEAGMGTLLIMQYL